MTDIDIQKQLRHLVLWEHVFDGVRCYRDTVERTHGIRFEIRTKEQGHNVPHCHACYGSQNISISLLDYSILAGNIPSQKAGLAVMWVKDNIDTLKTHWDRHHVMEV
ncbi:MAG: DUF4160 domain-containing protein [Bacillota bacterium]